MKPPLHLSLFALLCLQAPAATIGFDSLSDAEIVTTQFPGLTFQNAIVLTSGISLNEFEFPPASGLNVISDNGGPITIDFSSPITAFSAASTYSYNVGCSGLGCGGVQLHFFDATNTLQFITGSTLFQSNMALSGQPGSSPNEVFGSSLLGPFSITRVVISGDPLGGSFTLDDLTYTSASAVPEPGTLPLLLLTAPFIALLARRMISKPKKIALGIVVLLALGGGALWAQTTPVVSEIVLNPPAARGVGGQVLVTARLGGGRPIQNGVNLVRVGSSNAIVATMSDDGRQGDVSANDGVYSALITSPASTTNYQISAAFSGVLRRVMSPQINLLVLPQAALPPDFYAAPSPSAIVTSLDGGRVVVNELNVTLRRPAHDAGNLSAIDSIARGLGGVAVSADLDGRSYLIRLPIATLADLQQEKSQLQSHPLVEFVVENFITISSAGPPSDWLSHTSDKFWGFSFANIFEAWNIATGSDIKVAIIDENFDSNHADIKTNVAYTNPPPCVTPLAGINHGTHVAGIIGAANNGGGVAGVNWNVRMDLFGGICTNGLAKYSMQLAVNRGARVVNMSFGFVPASATEAKARQMADELRIQFSQVVSGAPHVLWVAAAGNESRDVSLDSPANMALVWPDRAISVAALQQSGSLMDFSNYGPGVSLAAPGEAYSTIAFDRYGLLSGTSMAAPFVTGAAALLLDVNPRLATADLKRCLTASSRPVIGLRSAQGIFPALDVLASLSCAGGTGNQAWPMSGLNLSRTYGSSLTAPATLPTFLTLNTNFQGALLRIANDSSLYSYSGSTVSAYGRDGSFKWSKIISPSLADLAIGPGGVVYASTPGTAVYALNPVDGSFRWSSPFQLTSPRTAAAPLAVGPSGTIYYHAGSISGGGQILTAINPDGTKKWDVSVPAQFTQSPVLSPDESSVYLIEGASSNTNGRVARIVPPTSSGGTPTVSYSPCAANVVAFTYAPWNKVLSRSTSTKYRSLSSDVQVCSEVNAANGQSFGGLATITPGGIVASTTTDHLYGATSEGTHRWSYYAGGNPGVWFSDAGGSIFMTPHVGSRNVLIALDASTGVERWRHTFPATITGVGPAPDGKLYVSAGTSLYRNN